MHSKIIVYGFVNYGLVYILGKKACISLDIVASISNFSLQLGHTSPCKVINMHVKSVTVENGHVSQSFTLL